MRKRILILAFIVLLAFLASCRHEGRSVIPGYTREEPGHWTKTGLTVRYAGDNADSPDGKTLTLTFPDGGELTVEPYWFEERYYDSDSVSVGINLILRGGSVSDDDAVCSVYFSDAPDGANNLGFFRDAYTNAELSEFSIAKNSAESTGFEGGIKHYVSPRTSFPASNAGGRADDEKLFIIIKVTALDQVSVICYEYTWAAEPETIVVPDQEGPIEYYYGCP